LKLRRILKRYKNQREKDIAKLLRESLGIRYKRFDIYLMALRHKSAARNIHNKPQISNERLEFLGDAILDASVADYLYEKYPGKEEGELTKIKSRIVSRSNLNAMANAIGVDKLLETDLQATHSRESIAGNALEALLGAMYLDIGYKKTHRSILHLLEGYTNLRKLEIQEADFKSRLYEEAHKLKTELRFSTVALDEKSNKKQFKSQAFIDQKLIGEGRGASKKKAEQAAAKKGLQKLNGDRK